MKRFMIGLLAVIFGSVLFAGDRFVRDDAKDIVVDTKTNLMWQDNSDVTLLKEWEDGIDYCENLTLGGYSDWHLPNYNELYSLIDVSRYGLIKMDPIFKNIASGSTYWTSTTLVNSHSSAYFIDFRYDRAMINSKSGNYYIRCVRDN